MRYINAIEGSGIALIIFSIGALVFTGNGPDAQLEIILTVSTFLFAILSGFFISRSSGRFDRIREHVASQDALFLSLYRTSGFLSTDLKKRFADLIDTYYIRWFDSSIGKSYKETVPVFESMYEELSGHMASTNSRADDMLDDMVGLLNELEDHRNKESVLILEKLTRGHWSILGVLAIIIIFCVYSLQSGTFYSSVIAVLLSTVLVLVLLILRDLQNLMLGGKIDLDESGQEVFELIGKPRYYQKRWVEQKICVVPVAVREYRLGIHEPGAEAHQIEMVKKD